MPPSDQIQSPNPGKVLILSDGKPGHVNQSVAFARLLELPYEIRQVFFRTRLNKTVSYLFDRIGWYVSGLFDAGGTLPYCSTVVSAGSETYYANRTISRKLAARSVAIMLPRGYRRDFDLIIAQQHDRPPESDHILTLPVNLSCPVPTGTVSRNPDRPCVAFIIGGPSRHYQMDPAVLAKQMHQVFTAFPDADFLATTSRRTPTEVEVLLDSFELRYKVIASRDQENNPVPDFLAISDYVFVTEDSTSMISEAVSFGQANVEILPLQRIGRSNKVRRMIVPLQQQGYLHEFDGTLGACHRKVDLRGALREVWR